MNRRPIRTCLIAVCTLIVPATLAAQSVDEGPPESSPLWWTLTDEVSPQDLHEARTDPDAALRRFDSTMPQSRELFEPGKGTPQRDLKREKLRGFVNGEDNPELVTMAEACDGFSVYFDPRRTTDQSSATIASWYQEFGISLDGADVITEFMVGLQRAYARHAEAVGRDLADIAKLIHEKESAAGVARPDLWSAFDENDFVTLSRELRVTVPELRAKLRYNYHPGEEYLRLGLPELRRNLTTSDWEGLRNLLLKVAAPMFSNVDVEREVIQ